MRTTEIPTGTPVVTHGGAEGVYRGAGRVAGRVLVYVGWPDGKISEYTVSAFKQLFVVPKTKKNALLSRPPGRFHRLKDTSWFRRAMGRLPTEADYDGIHTTSEIQIAGAYAMSAWEQSGGESDPEIYPIVLLLDTSGLDPLPDVDAMAVGMQQFDTEMPDIKEAFEERGVAGIRSLGENYDYQAETQDGDSPQAFVFDEVAHASAASALASWGEEHSDIDVARVIAEWNERRLVPPELLTALVSQQRYTQDFEIDRLVEVEAFAPWWGQVLLGGGDEEEDEIIERLIENGWEVFTLDDTPIHGLGSSKTIWRSGTPGGERRRVEYHGTISSALRVAFPGIEIPVSAPYPVKEL